MARWGDDGRAHGLHQSHAETQAAEPDPFAAINAGLLRELHIGWESAFTRALHWAGWRRG